MTYRQKQVSNLKSIKLHGTVVSGIGESRSFTEIPWVKRQFIDKLGFNPYPGTFNIQVVAEESEQLQAVKKAQGITIVPEEESFCVAYGFPVLINGKLKGAAIIPDVANYPPRQLEIIAVENIKKALSLKDGDLVEVEVYLRS